MADELAAAHHIFRHVTKSWTQGDFIEPAAFRLRERDGCVVENGVSVNWVEYFQQSIPQLAVPPLRDLLKTKGRSVGAESKFALLNVGDTVEAARSYCEVRVIEDREPEDPSHALIRGQEAHNDQVAEAISKKVLSVYCAGP